MAGAGTTKSLLATLSQRHPIALQFQQDRPFDTLASFGPALGTEGANLSNNALGRLMQDEQLRSSQSIAAGEAENERMKMLLSNMDKLSPGVRATMLASNPGIAQALGLDQLPPEAMQQLLTSGAGQEAAIAGAGGFDKLMAGANQAGKAGVRMHDLSGIENLLEHLGGDTSGFHIGMPTGTESAHAMAGQTTTERVGVGPDGRPITIREQDRRPTSAGNLPSGAPGPASGQSLVRMTNRNGEVVVQILDRTTGQVTHELTPGAYKELQGVFGSAQ